MFCVIDKEKNFTPVKSGFKTASQADVYEVELYKSRTPNHMVITPSKNLRAMWASGTLSI